MIRMISMAAAGAALLALQPAPLLAQTTLNVATAGDQNMVDYINDYLGPKFEAANPGVSVVAVDTQEDADAARAFLAAHDLSIPTVADSDGHIAAKLGVRELPTTIFLTSDHRVASMWEGPAELGRLKAGARAARDG